MTVDDRPLSLQGSAAWDKDGRARRGVAAATLTRTVTVRLILSGT